MIYWIKLYENKLSDFCSVTHVYRANFIFFFQKKRFTSPKHTTVQEVYQYWNYENLVILASVHLKKWRIIKILPQNHNHTLVTGSTDKDHDISVVESIAMLPVFIDPWYKMVDLGAFEIPERDFRESICIEPVK